MSRNQPEYTQRKTFSSKMQALSQNKTAKFKQMSNSYKNGKQD